MNLVAARMSQRWLAVGVVAVPVLLMGLSSPPSASRDVEPTAPSRVAPALAAPFPTDTLRTDATTGTPLILPLPAELRGAPVSRYTLLQGPALSGVAGRSLTWVPQGTDPGTYDIRLHAHHPDAQPDTLVVQVTLAQ
jgi:hypothetical protein